jgi:hypothetical protein
MSSAFRFDETMFPAVVLTCPRLLDESSIDSLAEGLDRLLQRRTKFVMICDTRGTGVPNAVVRKKLAELMNRGDLQERQARYQLGTANIIESVGVRAALTALLWLWTPPNPMASVATLPEAAQWAIGRLESEKITVPRELAAIAENRRAAAR